MTNMSNKSHYTSTQTASSSPGLRKGTFGTPMGIKIKKKNEVLYFTLIWKRNNGFIVFILFSLFYLLKFYILFLLECISKLEYKFFSFSIFSSYIIYNIR